MNTPDANKNHLRRQLRNQRRQLNDNARVVAAQSLCKRLKQIPLIQRAKRIAIYLAQHGEMSLTSFTQFAWQRNKQIYLPVLTSSAVNRMLFAPYTSNSKLKPNRFNINEPVTTKNRLLPGSKLDVVLVPLVAFDRNGNRLGMGGGFYDRTFSFRKARQRWRKPFLIGVAYDFQEIPRVKSESWDVPLDAVVTESRAHWFSHTDF